MLGAENGLNEENVQNCGVRSSGHLAATAGTNTAARQQGDNGEHRT